VHFLACGGGSIKNAAKYRTPAKDLAHCSIFPGAFAFIHATDSALNRATFSLPSCDLHDPDQTGNAYHGLPAQRRLMQCAEPRYNADPFLPNGNSIFFLAQTAPSGNMHCRRLPARRIGPPRARMLVLAKNRLAALLAWCLMLLDGACRRCGPAHGLSRLT
jgi:hypothetical protein